VKSPYLGNLITLPGGPSYPTFTDKVIYGVREKDLRIVELLDVHGTTSYGTKRATDGAGVVRTSYNLQEISLTPPCSLWVATERLQGMAV